MLLISHPNPSKQSSPADNPLDSLNPPMPSSSSSSSSAASAAAALQTADLRRIFNQLDRNSDGLLSIDELSWLLDRIALPSSLRFTAAELESSVGKSTLDFDDFTAFYASISAVGGYGAEAAAVERDLEEAFRVFDLDGDGFITSEELQKVLTRLGLWDGKDCRRMIGVYDTNRDGVLDLDEFKTMMLVRTNSGHGGN